MLGLSYKPKLRPVALSARRHFIALCQRDLLLYAFRFASFTLVKPRDRSDIARFYGSSHRIHPLSLGGAPPDCLYSRRINYQHRLVYKVHEEEKIIQIISLWTHYER